MLSIDIAVVTVGTVNRDIRSFSLTYQTVAIVYHDRRFTMDVWNRRPQCRCDEL